MERRVIRPDPLAQSVVHKIHSGESREGRDLDAEDSRLLLQLPFFLTSRRDRQTVR
jgi:hypothetical protein